MVRAGLIKPRVVRLVSLYLTIKWYYATKATEIIYLNLYS